MLARLALLIAGAVLAACAGCSGTPPPVAARGATPGAGRWAADPFVHKGARRLFPLEPVATVSGDSTDFGRLAHGRVTLVSLWATWCEACRKEFDGLNRLALRTASRPDALVVGVSVGESPATVASFLRVQSLRYAQLVDESFRLADALGQRDVPATLVVDREGRIVFVGQALDGAGLNAFRRALDE